MKKLSLILALMLIASSLSCALTGVAFAASETVYTSVIEDLSKDETFAQSNYPAKTVLSEGDKVMDVFQIAESNAGELFLYVYQPIEGKFTASEVRISQTIGEDLAPNDYKLTLLNRTGTLEKYKVEELQLSSDAVRHYLIVQLARPYDKDLDGEIDNDNKASTVAYKVAKLFAAETVDDTVSYREEHEDVITITAKYCGYIRNLEAWVNGVSLKGDNHFIAFDTDIHMDKLLRATVTYDTVNYTGKETIFGAPVIGSDKDISGTEVYGIKATLNADTVVQLPTYGWFGKDCSWTEIQSVEEFLELEEVTDRVRKEVEGKQWVLRFALTSYAKVPDLSGPNGYLVSGTRVTDASILELTFVTKGRTFTLGVVDNKQTEGKLPSNPNNPSEGIDNAVGKLEKIIKQIEDWFANLANIGNWLAKNWWIVLLGAVAVGLLIWLIAEIIKRGVLVVFKAIGIGLWTVLKWTVFLPFTLIYIGTRK